MSIIRQLQTKGAPRMGALATSQSRWTIHCAIRPHFSDSCVIWRSADTAASSERGWIEIAVQSFFQRGWWPYLPLRLTAPALFSVPEKSSSRGKKHVRCRPQCIFATTGRRLRRQTRTRSDRHPRSRRQAVDKGKLLSYKFWSHRERRPGVRRSITQNPQQIK